MTRLFGTLRARLVASLVLLVSLFGSANLGAQCVALPNGAVSWWRAEGDATDLVGGHDGTAIGTVPYVAGKVGTAFSFDRVSHIEVSDSPDFTLGTGPFTIELWVKFNDEDGSLIAHDERDGRFNKWIFWANGGGLGFHINESTGGHPDIDVSGSLEVHRWYHVAVTRSGGTFTFYIDGVPSVAAAADPSAIPDTAAPLTIGWAEDGESTDGAIDEVTLYNRALTEEEIAAIANAGASGKCHSSLAQQRCQISKHKAAGKYGYCRQLAGAKLVATGDTDKYSDAVAKCAAKLTDSWQRAEAKAAAMGDNCLDGSSTASEIQEFLDHASDQLAAALAGYGLQRCGDGIIEVPESCDGANLGGMACTTLGYALGGSLGCTAGCGYDLTGCVGQALPATGQTTSHPADRNDGNPASVAVADDGAVRAGAPLNFTDNGDGTITDNNTHLVWEKKDDAGGLHDKDNTYSWSGNGDTIWDWLDAVNAEGGTGLAGFSDWRIPNVKELVTLVDYEASPAIHGAFDSGCAPGCTVTACSCTQQALHWSSTTIAVGAPPGAWSVNFTDGDVAGSQPPDFLGGRMSVRAVRGGS